MPSRNAPLEIVSEAPPGSFADQPIGACFRHTLSEKPFVERLRNRLGQSPTVTHLDVRYDAVPHSLRQPAVRHPQPL